MGWYARGVLGRPLWLVSQDAETLDGPVAGIPTLAALEARQLALLACAVGDHLPVELALEVRELEARRRALIAGGAVV